jgi:VWFA-related protein
MKATVALLLMISSVAVLFAQQETKQEPADTLRVGTAAVQMDVLVTDKNGRRITGLTATDFQVLDEGKAQAVDYFTAIEDSHKKTEGSGSTRPQSQQNSAVSSPLTNPYAGRHIVILFDDLSLSADNSLRGRQAIAQYINTKLTSMDMSAIVSTGGSIASLQQFTNDKARLLAALRRIAIQTTGEARTRNRFNIAGAEAVRIEAGDERVLTAVTQRVSTESLSNQLGGGTSSMADLGGRADASAKNADVDVLKGQIRNEAHNVVVQSAQDIHNVISLMTNLFRSMAELPGRKIVVMLTQSLATLGGSSSDVSTQMYQLIDLARRSGVSVYALDAGGLKTKNATASEYITGTGLQIRETTSELSFTDFENLSAARALVAGTGGQLFVNTNDIEAGIERAVADSSSYYVLGFKPIALDNKFHRLTVSVKGRSDVVVRTRRGYLAVNQETISGTNTELAAALISPIPRLDLPLEVVANAVPRNNEQVIIPGLHIGRNYLTLPETTAADQTAAYEILAWVFAAGHDQPVGVIKRTVTYDFAKEPDARMTLKAKGFVYVPAQPLTLPAGAYQIRAVVREKSTGALGTNYQFFEVPDVANTKTPSLSSVLLTAAGQTGFDGTNSFKLGTEFDVHFIIYNLSNTAIGIEQRLVLTNEQGVSLMDAALPLSPATGNQMQALQGTRIKVPPARGRYAITVTIRDAKNKIDLERRSDFVVE